MLETPQIKHSFRSVWISDVHLGTRDCQAAKLLAFLNSTECDFLYLVGDIVDMWALRSRWYWPRLHNDVIRAFLRKAEGNTKVFYLPGNHDEGLRDFLGLEFGDITVLDDVIHTTVTGKRLLAIHGDQFDIVVGHSKWLAKIGDHAYRFLLVVNRWFNFARRKMGFSYWSLSAYLKHKVKNTVEFLGEYETALTNEARLRGVDGIICGHIHWAEIRELGPYTYYNDGDWVESGTALVEHKDGRLEIVTWTDNNELQPYHQKPR